MVEVRKPVLVVAVQLLTLQQLLTRNCVRYKLHFQLSVSSRSIVVRSAAVLVVFL